MTEEQSPNEDDNYNTSKDMSQDSDPTVGTIVNDNSNSNSVMPSSINKENPLESLTNIAPDDIEIDEQCLICLKSLTFDEIRADPETREVLSGAITKLLSINSNECDANDFFTSVNYCSHCQQTLQHVFTMQIKLREIQNCLETVRKNISIAFETNYGKLFEPPFKIKKVMLGRRDRIYPEEKKVIKVEKEIEISHVEEDNFNNSPAPVSPLSPAESEIIEKPILTRSQRSKTLKKSKRKIQSSRNIASKAKKRKTSPAKSNPKDKLKCEDANYSSSVPTSSQPSFMKTGDFENDFGGEENKLPGFDDDDNDMDYFDDDNLQDHDSDYDYSEDISRKTRKSAKKSKTKNKVRTRGKNNRGESKDENSDEIECVVPKCYQKFKSKEERDDHFRSTHQLNDRMGFCCDECGTKNCNIVEHLATALECPYCQLLYNKTQKVVLLDHIFVEHNDVAEKLICPICSKILFFADDFKDHKTAHGTNGSFSCVVKGCNKKFDSKDDLKSHVASTHDSPNELDRYMCFLCNTQSSTIADHNSHLTVHYKDNVLKCRLVGCTKSFANAMTRLNHERFAIHHGRSLKERIKTGDVFKCPLCSFPSASEEAQEIHIRRKHQGVKKPYKCSECELSFTKACQLRTHEKRRHVIYAVSEDFRVMKFKCGESECKFIGKSQCSLDVHVRKVHEGRARPFVCSTCGKDFVKLNTMLAHEETEHGGGGELLCTYCGIVYSKYNKTSLERHLFLHHPEAERHLCPICHKVSFLQDIHEKHLHLHKISTRKPHPCVIYNKSCKNKIFQTVEELRTHVAQVHNVKRSKPRAGPFICSICGSVRVSANALSRHRAVEHGLGKMYPCSYCPKVYRCSSSRMNHEEIRHLSVDEATRKSYQCELCGLDFYAKIYLYKHQARHRKGPFKKMIKAGDSIKRSRPGRRDKPLNRNKNKNIILPPPPQKQEEEEEVIVEEIVSEMSNTSNEEESEEKLKLLLSTTTENEGNRDDGNIDRNYSYNEGLVPLQIPFQHAFHPVFTINSVNQAQSSSNGAYVAQQYYNPQ